MNNRIKWIDIESQPAVVEWLEFPLNRTPYEVLGISERASLEEIRTAYKRLVFLYHPDRNSEQKKPWAEFMTAELNVAYSVLSNPARRAAYDRQASIRRTD